jgi:hypothetical protein
VVPAHSFLNLRRIQENVGNSPVLIRIDVCHAFRIIGKRLIQENVQAFTLYNMGFKELQSGNNLDFV